MRSKTGSNRHVAATTCPECQHPKARHDAQGCQDCDDNNQFTGATMARACNLVFA